MVSRSIRAGEGSVVVVGADVRGLTCAAYLARSGLGVTVVDTGQPDGPRSLLGDDTRIPEQIAAELALPQPAMQVEDHETVAVLHSSLGGEAVRVMRGADGMVAALRHTHRYEVENYHRYLSAAVPAVELLAELELADTDDHRLVARLRDRRSPGVATLVRWSRRSVADVLRAFFESEPLRSGAAVAGPVSGGRSPDLPGSGVHALWYARQHRCGPNGSRTDLRDAVIAGGGRIVTGTSVTEIVTDDTGVIGVASSDDRFFGADTVVISGDPRRAALSLLRSDVPGSVPLVRRWESAPLPEGHSARLDLVLDRCPRRSQDDDGDDAVGPMLVTPGATALSQGFRQMRQGGAARRSAMTVGASSPLDDGGYALSIDVHHVPYELASGHDAARAAAEWLDAAIDAFGDDLGTALRRWQLAPPTHLSAEGIAPDLVAAPRIASSTLGGLRRKHAHEHSTTVDGLFMCQTDGLHALFSHAAVGRQTAAAVVRSLGGDLSAVA